MSGVIHVDIQGQHYAVKSDLDPAYIMKLSTYVDERMRRAAVEVASADSVRVAVIAALNIADELFRARADGSSLQQDVLKRTTEIEQLLDAALNDTTPRMGVVNE